MKRSLYIRAVAVAALVLGPLLFIVLKGRDDCCSGETPPPPSTNTVLSANDLQFGREQVEQMLRDREEMATCVAPGDPVYQWAVRQFAGEATGHRTYWSPDPPDCPLDCMADNTPVNENRKGFIRIRERHEVGEKKGNQVLCEELWSSAVFELYNIANGNRVHSIYYAALAGKISKEEWVGNLTRLEFLAVGKTARFYCSIWRPWAVGKGMKTEQLYWYVGEPDNYLEWINSYKDKSGYPYSYYQQYEKEIAPYVQR